MKKKDPPSSDSFGDDKNAPGSPDRGRSFTETIDIGLVLPKDAEAAADFDLRNFGATSFGRFMQALPIPALLVDASGQIVFANKATKRISADYKAIVGSPVSLVFPDPTAAEKAQTLIDAALTTGKSSEAEGVLRIRDGTIWCRMSVRSVRFGKDRATLLLIENLPLDQRENLLKRKHAEEIRGVRRETQIEAVKLTEERLRKTETHDPLTEGIMPLRDILRVLYRRIHILKIVVVALPIATLITTFLVSPVYETSAKVLVTAKKANASLLLTGKESRSTPILSLNVDESDVNSEMELLSSRDLWKETVETLGLGYFETEHKGILTGLRGYLKSMLGRSAVSKTGQGTPGSNNEAQLDAAVTALVNSCKVVPLIKSKVIDIEFNYDDPVKAHDILSTHLKLYIPYHMRVHSLPGAQEFFKGQRDAYKKKLEEASNRVIEFRKKWGIASSEKQKDSLVGLIAQIEDSLVEINASLTQYRNMLASLKRKEMPTGQLAASMRREDENTVVNVIAAQLIRAQQKSLEAEGNFAPDSRDYRSSKAMVTSLTAKLNQALKSELGNLKVTRASLEEDLKKHRARLALFEEKAEEASRLQIEADIAKDTYVQYATRGEEARLQNMMQQKQLVTVRVVSQPFLPEAPVFPKKGLMILTAFLLAFPLGFGMILVANFLDRTFDTPQEVEAVTGQHLLASLRRLPS